MSRSRSVCLLLVLSLLAVILPGVVASPASARSRMVFGLHLSAPTSLAAGRSGTLYVLDWANPHIDKISAGGVVTATWPVSPVLVQQPGRIAVDGQENVYFLRNVRHGRSFTGAISKYSSTGRALATWFNIAWFNPIALAARADGTLSVLVPTGTGKGSSGMVSTVSPRGKVIGSWRLSTYRHDFFSPLAIATDVHGNLYVSGVAGSCSRGCQGSDANILTRLAPSGPKRLRTWTSGINAGPGLAADAAGRIYIAGDYHVSKVSPSGTTVAHWGTVGCGPLAFRALAGLAIDGLSHLYVLDTGNGTVQKISTSGQPEAIFGTCPPANPPTPIRPTPTRTAISSW